MLAAIALLGLGACHRAGSPSPAAADPDPAGRSLLEEANRELGLARDTAYTHLTRIDEAAGRFHVDCSGFVGYALARAAPEALDELRAATIRRPLAEHFVSFFESLPGRPEIARWQAVRRATELEPGDLLAWLEPADVASSNTGHVMIVRGPAAPDPDRPDLLAVPVIDATAVPHGKTDSRKAAHRTGLGTGEVLLVVDPRGTPIAYRWSRGIRAREHATTIAMARLR